MLGGDDWEAQYDGIEGGGPMHLRKLATYLAYFPGRTSKFNLFLPGPAVTDDAKIWSTFAGALSVGEIAEGARATDRARTSGNGRSHRLPERTGDRSRPRRTAS